MVNRPATCIQAGWICAPSRRPLRRSSDAFPLPGVAERHLELWGGGQGAGADRRVDADRRGEAADDPGGDLAPRREVRDAVAEPRGVAARLLVGGERLDPLEPEHEPEAIDDEERNPGADLQPVDE